MIAASDDVLETWNFGKEEILELGHNIYDFNQMPTNRN